MSKPASADNTVAIKDGPLNIYKYRWWFIISSLMFLLPGIYFIFANIMDPEIKAPVRLGIDFRGGTLLEYGFSKPISQPDIADIRAVFDEHGYHGSIIQIQEARVGINKEAAQIGTPQQTTTQAADNQPQTNGKETTLTQDMPPSTRGSEQTPAPESAQPRPTDSAATQDKQAASAPVVADAPAADGKVASIVSIRTKHMQGQDDIEIRNALEAEYGSITLLQKNSIGPALAKELLGNGLLALVMAYILIVGYLTLRFQFDYAVCAMIALVHDTIFLIGIYAMFGNLFHTEIDSLFITALLTVVGFSVHDTIVVFDRIRENVRVHFTKKLPFITVVNISVNQTLARSINTSLTALLTMVALYLFGGDTTKDFVLAIIIGIVAGTYSSIFVASALLAMWRNREQKAQPALATA